MTALATPSEIQALNIKAHLERAIVLERQLDEVRSEMLACQLAGEDADPRDVLLERLLSAEYARLERQIIDWGMGR